MSDKPRTTSKPKTQYRVTQLDESESAQHICEAERTREFPSKAIQDSLGVDWNDGLLQAQSSGEQGTDAWLKGLAARDAESAEKARRWAGMILTIRAGVPVEPPKPRRMKLIGAAELARADYAPEWLIEGILVARQPCLLGAPRKGLKTSIAIDLAVSIASGLPFLGKFPVAKQAATILFSGESGGSTIQDTSQRICHTKGIRLPDLDERYFVSYDLPQLADLADLALLTERIQEAQAEVVIVDPMYLCMSAGPDGRAIDMKNLFEVGPLLRNFASICLENGATPILLHHFNKLSKNDPYAKPDLNDLSYSGTAEFIRQWVLLNRRSRYEGGGDHAMWMIVGGSMGHSSEWALDVREGQMDRDFGGRTWEVEVKSNGEIVSEVKATQQDQTRARAQQKEVQRLETLRARDEKLLSVINRFGSDGTTQSRAKSLADLGGSIGKESIDRLLADGRIEFCNVTYRRGNKDAITGDGIRTTTPGQTKTDPDNTRTNSLV